jgi:hypothetical protein
MLQTARSFIVATSSTQTLPYNLRGNLTRQLIQRNLTTLFETDGKPGRHESGDCHPTRIGPF